MTAKHRKRRGEGGDPGSAPAASTASAWIYRPWLDLLVGCSAWSAPLLLLAYPLGQSHQQAWAVAFYGLALVFNYPHFMATIYRAYRTREEFSRYRLFTLHLTLLLLLTALLSHFSFRLVPWLFTVYVTWSPWHYTGQNYGLLMMFARRNAAQPSPSERHALYLSFLASYVMLFLTFHTGPSDDPVIISLGLPAAVSRPAELVCAAAFVLLGGWALWRLAQRVGVRALAAPLTLFASQFLWFVLPALLGLAYGLQVPQTRYSSGILAVLHSTQYLWITSYYARREAQAQGRRWRPAAYFAVLLAGGIALFIPGPWLVSSLFHYDFTVSFLIFTALVNIHHFLLDGAIWKLRDRRIAALLIDQRAPAAERAPSAAGAGRNLTRWLTGASAGARALRAGLAVALVAWGGLDLAHFYLGNRLDDLPALEAAVTLAPYDSGAQMRLARAVAEQGDVDRAVAALQRAIAANPGEPGPQNALARLLLESGRYADAYAQYQRIVQRFPKDADALVNLGILARQLGHPEEAVAAWQKALVLDPQQVNPHLYLAESLDEAGRLEPAVGQYQAYLQAVAAHPATRPPPGQVISVLLKLADAQERGGQPTQALKTCSFAVHLAEQTYETKLEGLALVTQAELQASQNQLGNAARSYQAALALDARVNDPSNAAVDWFNYGQFLRRHGQPETLVYACFLKAQEFLQDRPGAQLETLHQAMREIEPALGPHLAAVRRQPEPFLQQALALSDQDLAKRR
ncbi:MAG TPA: tetratricopeptide repeat protein [Terriglobales bacterium]|nr:tetratricopeptide repeat protein [Terriglobales bacterium]